MCYDSSLKCHCSHVAYKMQFMFLMMSIGLASGSQYYVSHFIFQTGGVAIQRDKNASSLGILPADSVKEFLDALL